MFVNTTYFSDAANHFRKHGYYCGEPKGSLGYYQYWSEELRRTKEGYSVGGCSITGDHYFFLNYSPIKRTENTYGFVHKKKRGKIVDFPDFWDGHYNIFHLQDIAFYGCTKEELEQLNLDVTPKWIDGGHHMIIAKARRKGISYLNAAKSANKYNTVRNSLVLMCAYDKKYLIGSKGVMTMTSSVLRHLNEHTAWRKRRQIIDRTTHKRASYVEYVNNDPIEKGYMSELEALTFKDNPDAPRGKDADLVLMEEVGNFRNAKDSYAVLRPCVEDGDVVTGQIIMYGTGGDMDAGTVDMEDMYYNPEPYNLLPVENIWDDSSLGTTCGYFYPVYVNYVSKNNEFMDKDGNSNREKAKAKVQQNRDHIKRTSKDPKAIDNYTVEYPFVPKEAFLQVNQNIFPVAELLEWRNEILRTKNLSGIGVAGVLYETKERIRFKPSDAVRPIKRFPHNKLDGQEGCVVIYQSPYRDNEGKVPNNLYLLVNDPYAHDKSTGVSVGVSYVIKRINNLSKPDDMIVASYIGRPQTQDIYNYNMFLLAEFYNAKIGFENDRGDVIPYARRTKKLQWLLPEIEIISKKDNINFRKLGRTYGLSMGSKERKGQGDVYIRDWILRARSASAEGKRLFNFHYIYDIGLIDEFIKYGDGNFDRISALRVAMYYLKDLYNKEVVRLTNKTRSEFFDREIFV